MQHPVGYVINHATGRAEMTSIGKVLTNPTLLYAFPHTIGAAVMTGGMLVVGVSAWHLARGSNVEMFARSIRIALPVVFVAALFTTMIGHAQAQLMTEQQPMKMAAAEALYETQKGAPFSLFAVAPFEHKPARSTFDISIPHGLSMLSTNTWNGEVEGINDLNRAYQAKYGPGNYAPIVGVTYWTFRIMTGIGFLMVAITALGMLLLWRGRARDLAALPARRDGRDRVAAPRERERLDLHRDGPPAVGRAGPAEDVERRLAERLGVGGRADARRLHACCTACWPPSTGGSCSATRAASRPHAAGPHDPASSEPAHDFSMAY